MQKNVVDVVKEDGDGGDDDEGDEGEEAGLVVNGVSKQRRVSNNFRIGIYETAAGMVCIELSPLT